MDNYNIDNMDTIDTIQIPKILPPRHDSIFKKILTDPKAKPSLISLVSGIILAPVVDATIQNVESPINAVDEKRPVFDVACTTDTGEQIDLEMQSKAMRGDNFGNEHAQLRSRTVLDVSKLFSGQNGRGLPYNELNRCYQATFCGFQMFPMLEGFVNRFNYRDENGYQLSDKTGIIFIELTKVHPLVGKQPSDMSALELWSLFFAYADKPEYARLMDKIFKAKEEIKLASEILGSISRNPQEQAIYHSYLRREMDEQSQNITVRKQALQEGLQQGLQQGFQRGLKEGQVSLSIEFARDLLSTNKFTVDEISRMARLSVEQVKDLR